MKPYDAAFLDAGGPYLCPLCLGRPRRVLVQTILDRGRVNVETIDGMPDCHVCAGAGLVHDGLVLTVATAHIWATEGCRCVACKVIGPGPTDSSRAKVGDDEDVPRVFQSRAGLPAGVVSR